MSLPMPQLSAPWLHGGKEQPALVWQAYLRGIKTALDNINDPALRTYLATNVTTDRAYDANATTIDELADVLGTLIADLRAAGIIG